MQGAELHEQAPPLVRPVIFEPRILTVARLVLLALLVHGAQINAEPTTQPEELRRQDVQGPVQSGLAHQLPGPDELRAALRDHKQRRAGPGRAGP